MTALPRRLACARCGTTFECGSTAGQCWCAAEDFRLPMPAEGEDCLCPACLRKMAAQAASAPEPKTAVTVSAKPLETP
jgi:hypothetical protein